MPGSLATFDISEWNRAKVVFNEANKYASVSATKMWVILS